MITENQVWDLLVESNPIPEIESQETSSLDGAAYLPTIQRRSSEVTQLDTKTTETENEGKLAKMLVAAAVLVVVGAGIFLGTREPDGQAPTATEPPPVTTQATTTTAPEVVSTPDETVLAMIAAYNASDLDTLMTYFTDTSFISAMSARTETHSGTAQIRIAFSVTLDFAEGDESITTSNMVVDGDRVTWDQVERRVTLEDRCHEGQVAIVRDGKIMRWDWPTEEVACP